MSDGRAQTQGISKSAVVTAGSVRLRKRCYHSCCAELVSKNLDTISDIILHSSALIATKVCNQISGTSNATFESYVKTCIDETSFDFRFKDFSTVFLTNSKDLSQFRVLSSHFSEIYELLDEN